MAIAGYKETMDRLPWQGLGVWLDQTVEWVHKSVTFDMYCLLVPLMIAILLTILRISLNWALFNRIPIWFNLSAEGREKFPESVWKGSVYIVTWIWAAYVISSGETNFFFDLRSQWTNWHPGIPVEGKMYWLYMVQMGFYLHCAYATLFLETIRRDFTVLMMHHVLTLGLLLFSFVVRFHLIGLLVLFVQDIGDIALEVSKSILYFKDRNGRTYYWPEFFANIGFAFFTFQHILFRLYWYPCKVIYSAVYVGPTVFPGGPWFLVFLPMLWGLYAMQVYWFNFIVRLLFKIFFKGGELVDTREFEEDGKKSKVKNGTAKKTVKEKKKE